MQSISTPAKLLAVLALGAGMGGCAQTATAPATSHVAQSDLHFITGLYNIVSFDRRVIGQEARRPSDPRVAALATQILDQANGFYAKVEPVAARNGIQPPEQVSLTQQSDLHSRVAALMAAGKYDYDQEFLSDEIAGHKEILAEADRTIQEPSGDPELRALIEEGATHLRSNLGKLEQLQSALRKEG